MSFCPSLYHSEIFPDGRYLLNIYHAPAKGGVRTKMMVKTWSSLKMFTAEDRARYLIHSGSAAPSASIGWKTMASLCLEPHRTLSHVSQEGVTEELCTPLCLLRKTKVKAVILQQPGPAMRQSLSTAASATQTYPGKRSPGASLTSCLSFILNS